MCESSSSALSCSLCGDAYDEPRLLPCLHSYCSKCIESLEELPSSPAAFPNNMTSTCLRGHRYLKTSNSDTSGYKSSTSSASSPIGSLFWNKSGKNWRVTCPTCDNEFKLDDDGASGLPINSLLQNKISTSASSDGSSMATRCEFCVSDVNAVAWCVECNARLCAFCVEAHRRQRRTSAHNVTAVPAENEDGQWAHYALCQRHRREEVTSYCEKCATTLCNQCIACGAHEDHRHVVITRDVTEEKIRDLKKRLMDITRVAQHFRDSLKDMREASKMIRTRETEVRQEVMRFYEMYAGAVKEHRKNLLLKLSKERDFKLNLLQIQRIQLEQALNDVDTSRHFAQQLLQEGSPIEILTLYGHVTERIEDVTNNNSEMPTMSIADDWLHFLPGEINQDLNATDVFNIKGDITSQKLSPIKCHIKGNALSNAAKTVCQRLEIVLLTKDTEGQSMTRGGHCVKIELTSKDKRSYSKQVKIFDQKDGTYLINLICPEKPGVYSLSILIQDQHIQGSPYSLPIKPSRKSSNSHHGIFHCCCFCSSGGSKSARCGCGATIPGGFRGCGHGHEGHPGKKHWSCCGNTIEHSSCTVRKRYEATL